MRGSVADSDIETLIKVMARLPGLGPRSARRAVLHLLTNKDQKMFPLIQALQNAAAHISSCETCGNLDTISPCRICQDVRRDHSLLCVVAGVADLWAVERTSSFHGRYHVLGGILSALDGIRPEDLRIESLIARVKTGEISEIILALSATVVGQATAHYLGDRLREAVPDIKITKLAHGVPVGGELDYLDDGTIATALRARRS